MWDIKWFEYNTKTNKTSVFIFITVLLCHMAFAVKTMSMKMDNTRLAHAVLCRCVRRLSEAFGLRYIIIVITVGYDILHNEFMNTYLKVSHIFISVFWKFYFRFNKWFQLGFLYSIIKEANVYGCKLKQEVNQLVGLLFKHT